MLPRVHLYQAWPAFHTGPAPVPSSILERSLWTVNIGKETEGSEKSLSVYLTRWWAHSSELRFPYLTSGVTKSTFLLRCLWECGEIGHGRY